MRQAAKARLVAKKEAIQEHRQAKRAAQARARRAAKKAQQEVQVGHPVNYPRLVEFFPTQAALATALGVSRETLRSWDEGKPSRLWRSTSEKVAVMAAVAEQVARFMPNDKAVGAWLLQPQPSLGTPAKLVREEGHQAYEQIVAHLKNVAEPVSVGSVDDLPRAADLQSENDEAVQGVARRAPAEDPDADPDFLATLDDEA